MRRKILSYLALPLLLLLSNSSGNSASRSDSKNSPSGSFNPGPDVIVGGIQDLQEYGNDGKQVGLGVSTTSCNMGTVVVDFFALPSTDHPVIPHNLYRMSGGTNNDERFEQVGQSWMKHAFGADQLNECGFGCIPGNFTHLGVGCSDTYLSFQNAEQGDLGSRAWINPFTGVFQTTANNHDGHVHTETSHRILVNVSDLNENLNSGASYYCEVQYITPNEYTWCQSHPGECNMYNNSSYRQFRVSGINSFFFSEFGQTMRMMPAIRAWTGATINPIEPEPGVDGRAFVAYKVTGPVAGVYHYEYAVYNENLDRGIQSFSVPLGCGITLSNMGFHAPPNPPGFPNDGTFDDGGFSNATWTADQTAAAVTWSTETFAQNQNANAIRWGTMYNFRFDSDHPPIDTNATVGFFKKGTPVTVAIQGPNACSGASPTPTATPTGTPMPAAQPLNISTRMRVQTGDDVGIGGFIVTGSAPKQVFLRGIGPSLAKSGVPDPLADPVLELHGPAGFATIINDNWHDSNCMTDGVEMSMGPGIFPTNDLESVICATLEPGAYTTIVRGKNNTSGMGLVEIYDLAQAAASKLANLSTRAFAGTSANVVIAGFILGNNSGNDRIVLRGIGPSLTSMGVANALADPTLEVRDSNGAVLRANNNWQDDPTQALEITGAGLGLTNQFESGIAITLPPGLYTGLLAGMNGGVGVGLIEVYDRGQ